MSGIYNGLQAKIKATSPEAVYIPCANHSLNLIGNCGAESCISAVNFFRIVERIYVFLSVSTYGWSIVEGCFENSVHYTVKHLSATRWSSRYQSVKSLKHGYSEIKRALDILANDTSTKKIAQVDALQLATSMESIEFVMHLLIWYEILERFDATSKSLQNANATVDVAADLYNSLELFVKSSVRNKFNEFEEARKIVPNSTFRIADSRKRRRQCLSEDTEEESGIPTGGRNNFKIESFYVICDVLAAELKRRSKAYTIIYNRFQCLFKKSVSDMDFSELIDHYKNDISCAGLKSELNQFLNLTEIQMKDNKPDEWYKFIITKNLQKTFPNLEIILRIFLTIPISNASGERSFSALKRVKNYLRSTLSQAKLSSLSLLYIENANIDNINLNDVINKFATLKSRKKAIKN